MKNTGAVEEPVEPIKTLLVEFVGRSRDAGLVQNVELQKREGVSLLMLQLCETLARFRSARRRDHPIHVGSREQRLDECESDAAAAALDECDASHEVSTKAIDGP